MTIKFVVEETVEQVEASLFGDAYTAMRIDVRMFMDDVLVGQTYATQCSNEPDLFHWVNAWIEDDFRGQGYGTVLYEQVINLWHTHPRINGCRARIYFGSYPSYRIVKNFVDSGKIPAYVWDEGQIALGGKVQVTLEVLEKMECFNKEQLDIQLRLHLAMHAIEKLKASLEYFNDKLEHGSEFASEETLKLNIQYLQQQIDERLAEVTTLKGGDIHVK